ncbi:hypothetical protein [Kitasatospora sp. NPDC093558]|uniref:hypothetical protein n=1 Tax=Kitasatospora sp. NPDC093558 TaxID=3155201 RepID=UPI003445C8B1
MSERYGIIPADALNGASYPVWVIQDHTAGQLVEALPPGPEPLRFYSYLHAERWVGASSDRCPDTGVAG